MKTVLWLAALLLPLAAPAAEPSPALKAQLDVECAKAARQKPAAPCAGVANATLFGLMMSPKFKEEATKAELGDAIKAHCEKVCAVARK